MKLNKKYTNNLACEVGFSNETIKIGSTCFATQGEVIARVEIHPSTDTWSSSLKSLPGRRASLRLFKQQALSC
jgi:hypothetical protein